MKKNYFKFINTGTIDRYASLWDKEKTQYIKNGYKRPIIEKELLKNLYPKRYKDSLSIKIIIAGMSKVLECFLDSKREYLAGKSTSIIIADIEKLKLLTGILNSKLLTKIYSYMFKSLSLAGGYFRIGAPQIKSLPIVLPEKEQKKELLKFVDKMFKLNKELQETPENSNKWNSIKSEIDKTDKKIDEEVYKLYGLTKEEIKIIESVL
ncbi:MAG: restriction endonuclease subunit S [Candidatus Parcubacteria bacterium]|nr:restriction endonuclease subunit S [Candidatus Parcubacteria bacterium]